MKKPVSVMIADSSEGFRQLLGEFIDEEDDMYLAGLASNGAEALTLAESLRPDVLITELILKETEGISLLRELKEKNAMPYTIVVSGFFDADQAEKLRELGAAGFLPKPCRIETLLDSVRSGRDAAEGKARRVNSLLREKREREIEKALLRCGFNPYVLGWGYIKAALHRAAEEPGLLEGVTKILYPELARSFDTSPGNFERCIRSAIEIAWRDGDAGERAAFFGPKTAPLLRKKPGNTKFLKLMLEKLRGESI